MPTKKPRDVLNALCETLAHHKELGISEETGIVGYDILTPLNIRVHPLKIDPLGNISMTIDDPPFLFEILPESMLRKHPLQEKMGPFPKYLEPYERPEAERPEGHLNFVWSSEARGREVSDYITYFAFKPARKKLPKSCSNLGEYRNLDRISDPDPFLTHIILEAQKKDGYPTQPHITMIITTDRVGQDNSIFYEELMPLLHAMQQRANQPKIPPEEWESAFDLWDEKYNGPYVFEDEKIFPVLMLSFLGPQHARVFYARMKDGEVIIGQSKLYSFEKKDDANIELFARLLLSTPVSY